MNIMNGAGKTPLDVALAAKDKLYLRFPKQDSMQSWLFISTDEGTEAPGTSDYQSDKFGAEDLEPHLSSSSEDEVQPSSLEEKKAIESEMEQLLKSVGAVRAESIQRDAASVSILPKTLTRESIGRAATYRKGKESRTFYKDLEDWMNEMFSGYMSLPSGDVLQALPLQRKELERYKLTGNRVLCLDGGGIKGLVQIDILSQIEEATGKRITDLFDWIIATSTGGILALAMVYGELDIQHTFSECQVNAAIFPDSLFPITSHLTACSGVARYGPSRARPNYLELICFAYIYSGTPTHTLLSMGRIASQHYGNPVEVHDKL